MRNSSTNSAKKGTEVKRQETAAIWKQRKQRLGNEHEFSISELQEQVREIVERKRTMKSPERKHYRIMSTENFREKDRRTHD
jgi:hypothetical protein